MKKGKDLAERMKNYEECFNFKVPSRSYVIIRLDGVGFSKFTKKFTKPFDEILSNAMIYGTTELCKNFNPIFAYTQSDEVSLVLTNLGNINSELIYDGKIQKLCSILASKMTISFNNYLLKKFYIKNTDEVPELTAIFDARVFIIPDITDVFNYFCWRQQDATRNSVSMAAYEICGHSATMNMSGSEKQEMLFEKGVNWNDYPVKFKRGTVICKVEKLMTRKPTGDSNKTTMIDENLIFTRNVWEADEDTPIFTQNKEYLSNLVTPKSNDQ
jgi:tRNA(His) guanylyltransferase